MNREQIIEKWDGMTPSLRDAWVAKEVTGVERKKKRIPCPDGIEGCAVAHYSHYPQYTTDISAAWEVVEELRKDWLVQLHDCDPFGWRIELISDSEYRTDLNGVVVRKVEEAICLAALIAKLCGDETPENPG